MLAAVAMTAPRWWGFSLLGWGSIWSEIVRLAKYQVVGFSNSVVSFAVLNLFYLFWAPTWALPLVVGSTVAYAAGDINSFLWNGRWTFEAGKPTWGQFGRFVLMSLAFMALNALVVWGASGWLLGLMLPAWLLNNMPQVIMAVTGAVGYLACRLWIFR